MGCHNSTQVVEQRGLAKKLSITLIDLLGATNNYTVPGGLTIFEVKRYLFEMLGYSQLRPDQVSLLLEDGTPISNESIIALLPPGVVLQYTRAILTEIMPQARGQLSERGGSYQMRCGQLVSRDQMHAYLIGALSGYDVIHMQGASSSVRCVRHINCMWELFLCLEVAVMTATQQIQLMDTIILNEAQRKLMERQALIEEDPEEKYHSQIKEEFFEAIITQEGHIQQSAWIPGNDNESLSSIEPKQEVVHRVRKQMSRTVTED